MGRGPRDRRGASLADSGCMTMSPFFRRRGRRNAKAAARPPAHAPAYRRDEGAVEYVQEQRGAAPDKATAKAGATDPRFRPLPRCPRCGTAIGFGQDKCHSCGDELTRS